MNINNKGHKIFLHIGYPKCLSTSLQLGFFSKCDEINYVGLPYESDNAKKILELNVRRASQRNKNIEEQSIIFSKLINQKITDEKITVISNEGFAVTWFNDVDPFEKAIRLKQLFPEAKIFVVIRNQLDLIRSIYIQKLREGLPFTFNQFLSLEICKNANGTLGELDFYDLINFYNSLFANKVEIFLKEEFDSVPKATMAKMSNFLGINHINHSLPKKNRSFTDVDLLKKILDSNKEKIFSYLTDFYTQNYKSSGAEVLNKASENINKITEYCSVPTDNISADNEDFFFMDKEIENYILNLIKEYNSKFDLNMQNTLKSFGYPI